MEIIDLSNSYRWDKIVKSFKDYDVYYLSGYAKGFKLHGDGTPILLYYQQDTSRGICVIFIREIPKCPQFNSIINHSFLDAMTPYGYGGFLFEGDINKHSFMSQLNAVLSKSGIISIFYRLHPILRNDLNIKDIIETSYLGNTVSIPLNSPQNIKANLKSENRTRIRKAIKNNVTVDVSRSKEDLELFKEIYYDNMTFRNAIDYYYFKDEYFNSVYSDLHNNFVMLKAQYQDTTIAMVLLIYANGNLHYHLGASITQFRTLGAMNLLLYKAALWGCENNFKQLHLGGGVGFKQDSLFRFKSSFNTKADNKFFISKQIVDQEKYRLLCELRGINPDDPDINFFPKYRY